MMSLLFLLALAQDCASPVTIEPQSTERRAPADRKLFPIYGSGGKIGFIDSMGRVVTPAQFERIGGEFQQGLMPVASTGSEGYLDAAGRLAFRAPGALAKPFSEGLAALKIGAKWGYIDSAGKVAIEPQFQVAGEFHGGLAPVRIQGKHGYVDTKGKLAIAATFRWADEFTRDGIAAVDYCGSCGYIDASGKPLFEQRFQRCYRFSGNVAKVKFPEGGGWGYVDRTGKVLARNGDWDGGFLSEGLLAVKTAGGAGFQNLQGEYAAVLPFSEGLAAVNVDGLWGFIDKTGAMVISPRFGDPENPDAAAFHNGLVFMADPKTGKYGFADRTGKWVIRPIYERCQEQQGYACGFHGELARVETKQRILYLNRMGRTVWSRPVNQ